jgi:hypothetical protein
MEHVAFRFTNMKGNATKLNARSTTDTYPRKKENSSENMHKEKERALLSKKAGMHNYTSPCSVRFTGLPALYII